MKIIERITLKNFGRFQDISIGIQTNFTNLTICTTPNP